MAKTTDELVGFVIRDFPEPLLRAVAERAEVEGSSMRAVMGNAIAAHYEVKWRSKARRSPGSTGATVIELKLPRGLRRKLHQEAARDDITTRAVVLRIIGQEFSAERAA